MSVCEAATRTHTHTQRVSSRCHTDVLSVISVLRVYQHFDSWAPPDCCLSGTASTPTTMKHPSEPLTAAAGEVAPPYRTDLSICFGLESRGSC